MSNKIDFVLMWVDGNDPEWQKEKETYEGHTAGDKRNIRFRDWDNLQYWFRAVEEYAPWVNKIHFVTWGHLPKWLNTKHPKLNIVNHDDFLNKDNLPVFNSRAIEVNLHLIPDIAEQFVYFNDDMFITKPVKETDFFVKGLPRDVAVPNPCPSVERLGIGCAISNNMEIINTRFNKRRSIKNNFFKWYNFKYRKHIIASIAMSPWSNFASFMSTHIPHSYLRSTFEEVWDKEYEILEKTSQSRFRSKDNINQWLMRYWQLAAGNFAPRDIKHGKNFMLSNDNELALSAIKEQKYKLICLNDTVNINGFEKVKKEIKESFNVILPNKSRYEKNEFYGE